MVISKLTRPVTGELFKGGGKMLRRIEAGVQRYVGHRDIGPL